MTFVEEFNHLIYPFVTFCGAVTVVGAAGALFKKHLLNGTASTKDLESGLESVKSSNQNFVGCELDEMRNYFQDKDDADKKWLNTLQNKIEESQKDIAEIKGELKSLKY